jgi:hypothetical protein
MARPLLALWLLERFDSCGAREALIGDLVEEIAQGRSRLWVWQQILALCGLAAVGQARNYVQIAHLIAFALGVFFAGGVWIAPPGKVFEMWAVVYFVSGTLSLFGDLITSRTLDSRAIVFPFDPDCGDREAPPSAWTVWLSDRKARGARNRYLGLWRGALRTVGGRLAVRPPEPPR